MKFDAASLVDQVRKSGELEHFGIKGMKWGVRRSRKELDKGKPKDPPDGKKVIRAKRSQDRKNVRRLTDKSLDAKIARLEKEKKLKELIDADISPGKSMLKSILTSVGKKTASKFLEDALSYAPEAASQGFDAANLAEWMASKSRAKTYKPKN